MSESLDNQAQAETEAATTPSAGEYLRVGREQAGWTLERLAGELCLPADRLRALEADDFTGFGGAVFVRGYLRRAAAVLGLPAAEIIASYESASGTGRPADIVPALPPGRPPRRGLPEWTGTAAAAAGVVFAMALTWWFMKPSGAPEPLAQAPAPATGAASIALPEAETVVELGAESAAGPEAEPEAGLDVEPDAGSVAMAEVAAAGETQALPVAAPTPTGLSAAAPAQEEGLRAPVLDAGSMEAAAALELPVTVELRFEFAEDCWVEINDARGTRLAYRLYRAGDVSRLRGVAPVEVFLGNAEGVRLTVDDTPVAVRPAAGRDGTARLTVGGGTG
jgi:cytoskeleton protein RodZ